jgi:hypothetical protein
MLQRSQKFVFVLALAAIALLAITTTVDLLPHHHDNLNERVCPICHPPLMGLQPTALRLPSLTNVSWALKASSAITFIAPVILGSSSRAPPF